MDEIDLFLQFNPTLIGHHALYFAVRDLHGVLNIEVVTGLDVEAIESLTIGVLALQHPVDVCESRLMVGIVSQLNTDLVVLESDVVVATAS